MERVDVLIVGGGPAGSACARTLTAAGRDTVVVDAAVFPRDKPCAGWITPEVLAELPFTLGAYAVDHVAQPITRFRVGRIDGRARDVEYGMPVSYGIRRCEFDTELLRSSSARLVEGRRIRRLERRNGSWLLDGAFSAPYLVGAGGHFCPVARQLGGTGDDAPLVVAKEIEFRLTDREAAACRVEEDRPELYFCSDLLGYGWCFRKGHWLNLGLGRLDPQHLTGHVERFIEFLRRDGRIDSLPFDGWRGHAYRVRRGRPRRLSGDGFLLVGDAAGLAAPASGEGILPALLSGRLAAEAILDSGTERYESRIAEAIGPVASRKRIPAGIAAAFGSLLLSLPGFASRVVLDRWFLHRSH